MTKLVSTRLNATELEALTNLKAAMARNDGSDVGLMGLFKEKAKQFNNNGWEVTLTIAAKAADLLAGKARESFSGDATVEAEVIQPLTAFAESFKANPGAWLTHNIEGSPVTSEVAAGLLTTLQLLQENPRLRMDLLAGVNKGLEKSIGEGDKKIVLSAKASAYTKQLLKPMSKRDLTTQIVRLVFFLTENPDGFTIH